MFAYDPLLLAAVQTPPDSIADVLTIMNAIEATCADTDGLKWFNWLYLQVTQAVKSGDASPWLAELDVQFARLYFGALGSYLAGQPAASCWRALFDCRDKIAIARIQFALAGINAHINHDLPLAILATGIVPQHGTTEYSEYTALNSTLDNLVEAAKTTLHVRLPGDALPAVTHLEDLKAAFDVSAAREAAWQNSEVLWHLRNMPPVYATFVDTLDGLTTVAGKALLVPVP